MHVWKCVPVWPYNHLGKSYVSLHNHFDPKDNMDAREGANWERGGVERWRLALLDKWKLAVCLNKTDLIGYGLHTVYTKRYIRNGQQMSIGYRKPHLPYETFSRRSLGHISVVNQANIKSACVTREEGSILVILISLVFYYLKKKLSHAYCLNRLYSHFHQGEP